MSPKQQREVEQKRLQKEKDEQRAEKEKEVTTTTRRTAVGLLAGTLAVAEIGDRYIAPSHKHKGRHSRLREAHQHHPVAVEIEQSAEGELFDMGELAGVHVAGLEGDFLGVENGKLPEKLVIDYSKNLTRMWNRKVEVWEKKLEARGKHLDINVLQMRSDRTGDYESRWKGGSRAEATQRTTLKEVSKEIDQVVDSVKENIDPEQLRKTYRLSAEQLKVVGTLAVGIDSKNIDARGMLAAYSMTELLPKWNGEVNAEIYDFLLRTAGKEFMANIPSMGDPATSFGPLQFTAFALADYTNTHGVHERHGASVAGQLLPKDMQLPKSLDQLHGFVDHFKAGYLFALNNLATYVHRINDQRELDKLIKIDKGTLLAFLSASHNNPNLARKALNNYLLVSGNDADTFVKCAILVDEDRKKELEKKGKRIVDQVKISDYAQKTIANFKGLQDYLDS